MADKTLDLEKKLLGQWNALVRRARIGRDYKVAALTVSSYADADGTDIRLSVARYAVDLEVSYSTARRYLTWLRKVGLLEMTRAGSRRKGTASEYRLIFGPDVLETLDVLTPARQKELADEMREANRAGVRGRAAKAKAAVQRSPETSAEPPPAEAPSDPDLRSPEQAQMTEFSAQMGSDQRSPWMTHTPSRTHLSVKDRPSRADDEDLRTAVTVARVPDAAEPKLILISGDDQPGPVEHTVSLWPAAVPDEPAPRRPPPSNAHWAPPRRSPTAEDAVAAARQAIAAARRARRAIS